MQYPDYTPHELMHQRLNYTSNCMTEMSYQLRELRKIPESALDSAQLGKLHRLQARVADFIEEFSGFKR